MGEYSTQLASQARGPSSNFSEIILATSCEMVDTNLKTNLFIKNYFFEERHSVSLNMSLRPSTMTIPH